MTVVESWHDCSQVGGLNHQSHINSRDRDVIRGFQLTRICGNGKLIVGYLGIKLLQAQLIFINEKFQGVVDYNIIPVVITRILSLLPSF